MKLQEEQIVLFRKGTGFISKAISHMTASSYAHAGLINSVDKEFVTTVEALGKGVTNKIYKLEDFNAMVDSDELLIRGAKCSLSNFKEIVAKYNGRPYGYLDILLIALYIITGKHLFKGSAKSLICSETVARILYDASDKKIDFSKEFDKPYSYITPDDLFMSKQLKTIRN